MGFLVLSNPFHIRVEGVLASGSHEVRMGVVLHALFVKGCLQMLEGQGIIENVG